MSTSTIPVLRRLRGLPPELHQDPGNHLPDRADGGGDVLMASHRDVANFRPDGHIEQISGDPAADGREHVVHQALLDIEQRPGHLLRHRPGELAIVLGECVSLRADSMRTLLATTACAAAGEARASIEGKPSTSPLRA